MANTTTQAPQAQQAPQAPLHNNPGVAKVLRRAMAIVAAGGAPAQVAYTPNQWVAMLGGVYTNTSGGLGKATARTLRGLVGRAAGTGVGRGNTYPPTTAAQLLALAGYGAQAGSGTPKAYTTANTGARKVWGQAAQARAQQAQARTLAAQANAPTPAK